MIDEREPAPTARAPAIGRDIARLRPDVARRYTALVAEAAPAIESALGDRVMANRVVSASREPPLVRIGGWRAARRRFARGLESLARTGGVLLFTDVRRCYASIRDPIVRDRLRALGVRASLAAEVAAFLRDLRPAGVVGLPVGPVPSAVLANAVLAALDEAVTAAGMAHLRWVDDVAISVAGPEDAGPALAVVDEALGRLGLERNEEKTRLVTDRRAARAMLSPHG